MIKKILILVAIVGTLVTTQLAQGANVDVTVGNSSGSPGDTNIEIPISVSDVTGLGIISADLQLNYDSSRLTFSSLTTSGTIAQSWGAPVYNANTPGQIKIAMYGVTALSGQGNLLKIYFNVKSEATAGTSTLTLAKANFSGGHTSTIQNGAFTVIVQNRPPVLELIGNKQIDEGATLIFNISATDPDGNSLTYSASGLPSGATFNTSTRSFSWTPDYTQAGSYKVTFSVSDGKGGSDSEEITITVNNVVRTYTLTISATNGTVSKNPNQTTYNEGSTVTLTATPNTGYGFSSWSGDLSGSANPATITMNSNKTVTANFVQNTYTLTINATNGSVSKEPNQTSYAHGTAVKLTATANTGYLFNGWSGDLSGKDNPATITMDRNKSITANFTVIPAVSVTVAGAQGQPAEKDITVPISVSDITGLGFISCQMDLKYDANLLVATGVNVTGAITSGWGSPTYNLKTGEVIISLYGTTPLTGAGKLVNLVFEVKASALAQDTSLDLTEAKFNDGAISSTLVDGVFKINPLPNRNPVLADIGNKSIDEGKLLEFTISATDADGDSLTYSAANLPTGATFSAANKTFSWTPDYTRARTYNKVHFEVSDGSLTDSEDITITVNNVNQPPVLATIGDQTIDEGKLLQFTISATDVDGDKLTYSASGFPQGATFDSKKYVFSFTPTYAQAGSYTVTFTVNDGTLSDSETITITVNDVIRKYKLNIQANNGSVTKSPNQQVYDENTSVILTAVPNQGYTFVNWSGDLSGTSNPVTILMDGDKSISAVFVDSTPPDNCSLVIEQDAKYANNPKVNLTIVARDLGSGLAKMQFSEDGIKWPSPENYANSKKWTLSSGDGTKTVYAKVIDAAGNVSAVFSDSIILDTQAPQTPLVNPILTITKDPDLNLSGTKDADSSIWVNGQEKVAIDAKTDWSGVITLHEGSNKLSITSKDAAGNESAAVTEQITLKTKTAITIIWPLKKFLNSNDLITGTKDVTVLYMVDDELLPRAKRVTLEEGKEIKVDIDAQDTLGNKGSATISLLLDSEGPIITITDYQNDQIVSAQDINLKGKVVDKASGVQYVKVNGKLVALPGNNFSVDLSLSEGTNSIAIETADNAGNISTASLSLNYTAPPEEPKIETEETKSETVSPSTIYIIPSTGPAKKAVTSEEEKVSEISPKAIIRHGDIIQPRESHEEPQPQGQEPQVYSPPTYYEESEVTMPKIKEISQKPTVKIESSKQQLAPQLEGIEEITEMPVATAKEIRHFLIFRVYKLEVSGIAEESVTWELAEGQRLPFWLGLAKKKGIISGIVWGKREIELRLYITTPDGERKEVTCKIKIN